jgi:hypothetical protein
LAFVGVWGSGVLATEKERIKQGGKCYPLGKSNTIFVESINCNVGVIWNFGEIG